MSRIRILSEHLANQIAAGEVVERPASVVKELVENSIDAGARQIDVQVEGSGVRLLRVVDDGCGMVEDDVLLCLERHATSKIAEESQLGAIATLGFRGEALPSIASVARMTLLSRVEGKESGTRAEVRYGKLHAIHEDGCRNGTIVEIRHLFGNVPARKKFLKSARTETHHIEEVIKNQALALPELGFTLQVDGRTVLDCPPGSDLETRVRYIFRYSGKLLSLEHAGAAVPDDAHVGGYLLLPETAPARSARLRILVNGRAVQDRIIRNAVVDGLQGFLMKGYQPAGAVLLDVSPEMVDVNVHPAKREIRFRDHRHVYELVRTVVRQAICRHQEHTRETLFGPQVKANAEQTATAAPSPLQVAEPEPYQHVLHPSTPAEEKEADSPLRQGGPSDHLAAAPAASASSLPANRESHSSSTLSGANDREKTFAGLRLIGQLFSLYLLGEKDEQLVVIDQHAAHERILYGQLKQGYLAKEIPRQNLLFPVTIELGPDHMETIERHHLEINELGVELDYFGDSTWVIKSVPASMRVLDPATLVYDLLEMLEERKTGSDKIVATMVDDLLASMACKAAIKAGNTLEPQEMLSLLQQMEESDVFSHCPHGRPVVRTFTAADLEKWFHRHGG